MLRFEPHNWVVGERVRVIFRVSTWDFSRRGKNRKRASNKSQRRIVRKLKACPNSQCFYLMHLLLSSRSQCNQSKFWPLAPHLSLPICNFTVIDCIGLLEQLIYILGTHVDNLSHWASNTRQSPFKNNLRRYWYWTVAERGAAGM